MLLEESAHGNSQCTSQVKMDDCKAVQDNPRRNEFRRGFHNYDQSELGLLRAAASLGFIAALCTFRAALLHGGTAGFVFGAALLAFLAAAELGIGYTAGWLLLAASEFQVTAGGLRSNSRGGNGLLWTARFGRGRNLLYVAAGFDIGTLRGLDSMTLVLGGGRSAASLSLIAAGRSGRAALLHSGTASLVFGTALLALLAAAELRIGHAAGAWLCPIEWQN
jgi:hypothetical protein